METKEVKKDYSKEVEYVANNLSEKCMMLQFAAKHITKRWRDKGIDNEFRIMPSAIYYNQAFRVKIMIESAIGSNNTIFYSRQSSISVDLWEHKFELREAIQEFVFSVIGDLMEEGTESFRRKAIQDTRDRMYTDTGRAVPGSEKFIYPLTIEECTNKGSDEAEIVE
jgi:hypothetical protein